MLSLDFIRENKQKVIEAAKNKNREIDLDKIIGLDDKRLELIHRIQKLREERNKLAKEGRPHFVPKNGTSRGKEIKEQLKKLEEQLKAVQVELDTLVSYVPNVPLDEVPIGKDASKNKEL